ncbi:hypothetical protein [Nostoc sp.]
MFRFVSPITTKKPTSTSSIAVASAIALCEIFLKGERSLGCGNWD